MVAAAVVGGAVIGGVASSSAASKQAKAAEKAGKASLQASQDQVAMLERQYNLTRSDLAPYRQTGYQALARQANLLGLPGYLPDDSPIQYETRAAPYDTYNFGFDGSPLLGAGVSFGGQMYKDPLTGQWIPGLPPQQSQGDGPMRLKEVQPGDPLATFQKSPNYQFLLDETTRAINARNSATGSFYSGKPMRELARYAAGLASNEFGEYYNRLAGISGTGQTANTTLGQIGAGLAGGAANAIGAGASNYGGALMQAGAARASGVSGIGNSINSGINNYLYAQAAGVVGPSSSAQSTSSGQWT